MYPKHPDSPFYGGGPIKPMATVTLTKLKESCNGEDDDESSEDIPSTEDLIDMMKQKMMLSKKLGAWSSWFCIAQVNHLIMCHNLLT